MAEKTVNEETTGNRPPAENEQIERSELERRIAAAGSLGSFISERYVYLAETPRYRANLFQMRRIARLVVAPNDDARHVSRPDVVEGFFQGSLLAFAHQELNWGDVPRWSKEMYDCVSVIQSRSYLAAYKDIPHTDGKRYLPSDGANYLAQNAFIREQGANGILGFIETSATGDYDTPRLHQELADEWARELASDRRVAAATSDGYVFYHESAEAVQRGLGLTSAPLPKRTRPTD